MSRLISIHPETPQERLLQQAAAVILGGGIIVFPTDTGYAFGWALGDRVVTDRVRRLRGLDDHHHFTLVVRDLSQLATYARVEDPAYRVLRAHTPGPYTFILRATREVPKRLVHEKKRTIGLRVPDNRIAQGLLAAVGEPIQSTSLVLPDAGELGADPRDIFDAVGHQVDLVIDGGYCGNGVTTVVDLTDGVPVLVRRGAGDCRDFE